MIARISAYTLFPMLLAAQTRITGSGTEQITAAVRGPDGFVYATGITNSPDFPTTIPPVLPASTENFRAFVVKMNDQGEVIYSVLIAAPTASPRAIAVNPKGEVLISGQSVELGAVQFPVTPGSVGVQAPNTGFLIKLDASGSKVLVGIRGYGMGPVAYDAADNIYVAGTAYGDAQIYPTPGAFQSTHESRGCGGTGFLGIGCFYQYVAKISSDGTKLLYSTFVTGSYGAQASALLVDKVGTALIAGTTNSPDYPVTPGSLQPEYRAASPAPPPSSFRPAFYPPPASGFVTKLNPDGTGLLWSTFFSGTGSDSIEGLQLAADGNLFITGSTASRDLPKAQPFPLACPLGYYPEIPYAAELSGDGKQLMASRYLNEINSYLPVRVAIRQDGTPQILPGKPPSIDVTNATAFLCVVDTADNTRLRQIAPGQLLTVFGPFEPGIKVSVDRMPASILYESAGQLNIQTPIDLKERRSVELSVQYPDGASSVRIVEVTPRAPSAFLDLTKPVSPLAACEDIAFSPGYAALIRNEDGSLNSCENRATPGSVITIYLNGLGNGSPVARLSTPESGRVLSLEPDSDASTGVWRMRVQLPANATSGFIQPLVDGLVLRYQYLAVWVGRG